jgi:hypothetical protein
MKARLKEIATLMRACFGETNQVFVRAEECSAAAQRLEWELDRTDDDNPAMPGVPFVVENAGSQAAQ